MNFDRIILLFCLHFVLFLRKNACFLQNKIKEIFTCFCIFLVYDTSCVTVDQLRCITHQRKLIFLFLHNVLDRYCIIVKVSWVLHESFQNILRTRELSLKWYFVYENLFYLISFCFCTVYVKFTYFAKSSEVYIIDQSKQITYTSSTYHVCSYHHNKSDKPLI